MQAVDAYFHQLRDKLPAQGPGFSAVALQNGRIAFEMHHGMASVELQVPLSGDSAYYLASESKQFTAASVLTMVRDGLIGLDDDVVAYLPELKGMERAFPLRTLLNHTSGIPDYLQFIYCQLGRHDSDYFNNGHILRIISCFDEPLFPVSSQHDYSNSNYILLATLVERLTGVPLARHARTHLFEPLQMRSLGFDADRSSIIPHRVFSYEGDISRSMALRQSLGNANTVGDGGVYGSTNELIRWERDWHRQWTDQGSLLHSMLPPVSMPDGSTLGYRFGLEIGTHHGEDHVFHSGGLWGFRSLILRLPARGLSIVHLANHEDAGPDMQALLDACNALAA